LALIYITGDLHGDLSRLKSREVRRLKKGDTLIVCGDFGFVWDDSPREKKILKWIGKRRYNLLFVEGGHDKVALLSAYPAVEWQGGKTREISGRLRLLCRGEVFEIEGKKIFAFGGGGYEDDASLAINEDGGDLPSPQEIENGRQNLARAGYSVDYIVTHRPSRKIAQFLMMGHNSANVLDAFLDEVREKCAYTRWFFGCIHKNKPVPPGEMALFTAVVPAGGEIK